MRATFISTGTEYFLASGFFTKPGFLQHKGIDTLSEQFARRQRKIFGEYSRYRVGYHLTLKKSSAAGSYR